MTLKIKKIWLIFCLILCISSYIIMRDIFINKSFFTWFSYNKIRGVFALFGAIYLPIATFFFFPYVNIILDDKGIRNIRYFGFLGYKIYKFKVLEVKWSQINKILALFPLWFPLPKIIISGKIGSRLVTLPIEVMTNHKEALLFISKHISSSKINYHVQRYIDKYQLKKLKKDNKKNIIKE